MVSPVVNIDVLMTWSESRSDGLFRKGTEERSVWQTMGIDRRLQYVAGRLTTHGKGADALLWTVRGDSLFSVQRAGIGTTSARIE